MRYRIGLIVAGALIITASQEATAQLTGVVTGRTLVNQVGQLLPDPSPTSSPVEITTTNAPIADGSVQNNYAARFPDAIGFRFTSYSVTNYQVATDVDATAGHIAFAANSTASGQVAYNTVETRVQVSYTNSGPVAVDVTLQSQITPAGFGVYVANPSGNEHGGDINFHPENTSSSIASLAGRGNGTSDPIAQSRVLFQILSDSVTNDPTASTPVTVASYVGSLQVLYNSATGSVSTPLSQEGFTLDEGGTARDLALTNFRVYGGDSLERAIGYHWDATDVLVSLGSIAAGETKTLTYMTRVETDIRAGLAGSPANQLLAYAGFGDPIGAHQGGGGIADPDFPLLNLSLPTLTSTGATTALLTANTFQGYQASALPLQQINGPGLGAVPEPASWTLLTAGFGLVGAAVRRRRARAPGLA